MLEKSISVVRRMMKLGMMSLIPPLLVLKKEPLEVEEMIVMVLLILLKGSKSQVTMKVRRRQVKMKQLEFKIWMMKKKK